MKRFGDKSEFEDQRNRDLMRNYHSLIEGAATIYLPDILHRLVNSPAERFYVSEERAFCVIKEIITGERLDNMIPSKREMFFEIYKRVKDILNDNQDLELIDAVSLAVHSPAPKFYLTPGSAKVLISKIKKQWYEARKRKLRHLF